MKIPQASCPEDKVVNGGPICFCFLRAIISWKPIAGRFPVNGPIPTPPPPHPSRPRLPPPSWWGSANRPSGRPPTSSPPAPTAPTSPPRPGVPHLHPPTHSFAGPTAPSPSSKAYRVGFPPPCELPFFGGFARPLRFRSRPTKAALMVALPVAPTLCRGVPHLAPAFEVRPLPPPRPVGFAPTAAHVKFHDEPC